MKSFFQIIMCCWLGLSLAYAEGPVIYQGIPVSVEQNTDKNRVVRGILVGRPYREAVVYQGYRVDTRPVYRGILVSPGWGSSTTTRYHYEDPGYALAESLITFGIVGGLTALILSSGHHHGYASWGHHHRSSRWRGTWGFHRR
ncbi:MAG: hypothetical protein JW774_10485 [Candidatus Aureabacteria bacterium]|nr:hypothetical protein [Candidatus Auribacterota bacterium]